MKAQTVVQHFTIEDGLPSNEVHFVHQDKQGYFWFCTDRGVSRYNGYEFTNYTVADGLSNNVVFKCFEDWNGDLWFTSIDGSISVYSQKERRFGESEHSKWLKSKYAKQQWVQSIGFKEKTKEVFFFMTEYAPDSTIYYVNANGDTGSTFLHVLEESNLKSFDNLEVLNYRMFESRLQLDVLYLKDSVANKAKIGRLIDQQGYTDKMYPYFMVADGNLYISSGDLAEKIISRNKRFSLMTDIASSCVYKDREGFLWITSINDGIYLCIENGLIQIDLKNSLTRSEKISIGKKFGDVAVLGIIPSRVLTIEPKSGNIVSSISSKSFSRVKEFFFNRDSTSLSYSDFKLSIENGVYKSRINTVFEEAKLVKLTLNGSVKELDYILPKLGYSLKDALLGFKKQYGERLAEWVFLHDKYEEINSFSRRSIEPSCHYKEDCIYMMSNTGLMKIYADSRVGGEVNLGNEYRNLGISAIDNIDEYTLLATKGRGVLCVMDDAVSTKLNVEDGLLSKVVNALYLDRVKKMLWCGTDIGVSVFQYSTTNDSLTFNWIRNIRKIDGLYSNYINDIEPIGDDMFTVSDRGLSIIPASYAFTPINNQQVILKGFVINDSIYTANDEQFSYDENNIEFRYETVSIRRAKGTYRYRLVSGSDSVGWSITDTRSVRINNIAPGSYVFQVCARPADGEWSPAAEYRFTITPRFVDRWWVRGFILLALFGGMYLIFRSRIKRLKERSDLELSNRDLELQVAKLEASSLRGQMNPHFMFNVLNSIQKLILTEEKEDANKLLARFSKLVRSALQFSRLDFIPLEEEVAFLTNYMNIESQRFPGRFSFTIDVKNDLMQDAKVPPLLIQPLCENAIKHAFVEDGGHIWVTISLDGEEQLQVVVVDDGIGIANTEKVKEGSLGTTIIRDRLKLIKKESGIGTLTIETRNENTKKGTKATLIIPYT